MDLIRASAFAHIVLAIVLMGFALFWLFMDAALRARHGPAQARELMQALGRARWPHVAVPPALRVPLPWVSWFVIAALILTGAPGAAARGMAGALPWIKVALFVAVLVVQALMTRATSTALVRLNFALVAAVIVVSAWAVR